MKAQKVTVKIELNALSIDTLGGMLAEIQQFIKEGAESGHLEYDDGDQIKWQTTRKDVEF